MSGLVTVYSVLSDHFSNLWSNVSKVVRLAGLQPLIDSGSELPVQAISLQGGGRRGSASVVGPSRRCLEGLEGQKCSSRFSNLLLGLKPQLTES